MSSGCKNKTPPSESTGTEPQTEIQERGLAKKALKAACVIFSCLL
jgi:hypothetical protein